MKLQCKCGNIVEILEDDFKNKYPSCNKCGGKFIFYCNSCKAYLYGKPKICFEKSIYCFSCAKKVINAKKEIIDKKNEVLRLEYDKVYSKWNTERNKVGYEETNWIIPMGFVITAVLPIWFLGAIGIGIAVIAEGIAVPILLVIRSKAVSKRQQDHSIIYPPPQSPKYKFMDFFLLPFDGYSYDTNNYRAETIDRDNSVCQNCNKVINQNSIEVHHIIPKARNGEDYPSNLVTLCFQCHKSEGWFGHQHYYR